MGSNYNSNMYKNTLDLNASLELYLVWTLALVHSLGHISVQTFTSPFFLHICWNIFWMKLLKIDIWRVEKEQTCYLSLGIITRKAKRPNKSYMRAAHYYLFSFFFPPVLLPFAFSQLLFPSIGPNNKWASWVFCNLFSLLALVIWRRRLHGGMGWTFLPHILVNVFAINWCQIDAESKSWTQEWWKGQPHISHHFRKHISDTL